MTTSTNDRNRYGIGVDDMEPGVIYTVEPGKDLVLKLRRENRKLKRELSKMKLINIVVGILFLAVCAFSCFKFNQLTKDFQELSKNYDGIINARNTISYNAELIDGKYSDYATYAETLRSDITIDIPELIIPTHTNNSSDDEPKTTDIEEDDIPTTETPIVEATTSIPSKFDVVPLDDSLKEYIYNKAIENDIPPEVLFSMAWKESTYSATAKSGTNDHGLFQINECNFSNYAAKYGYTYAEFCEKIYDPYVNTDTAVDIIVNCRDSYVNNNWHHVLMRYNMGPAGASEQFNKGVYSTSYSRDILNYASSTFGFTDIEL